MTNYTINNNKDYNSIEISFNGKPSEEVRNILKSLKFRWHGIKKVWYGYADEQTIINALNQKEAEQVLKPQEKKNKYGVKVGDIFSSSWGYDQTNVDFFQVVKLVGESSVRVREVNLPMVDEKGVSSMSSDRTYKLTDQLLPPARSSVFIEDQENGDLKRIKPGYCSNPEDALNNCYFILSSFVNAHKCNGDAITVYESWYA